MSDTRTQRWTFGEITITSVVEAQTDHIPPAFFYPGVTTEQVVRHAWVIPTWADADGNIGLRVQALIVDTPTRRILVDPCVGNGKTLSLPFWNQQSFPFLERFRAAGFDEGSIDLVVHTHLHEDHIGWDTHLVGGRWTPTFPNARHLYIAEALDALRHSERDDPRSSLVESIDPIVNAGLADVVPCPTVDPLDLGEGITLEATLGHTPGHVSMWIRPLTDSTAVLITGDFVHHPVQLSEPDWAESADLAPAEAAATRRRMFASAAADGAFVIGTHFPSAPAGTVVSHGNVWRFVAAPAAFVPSPT